MSSPDPQKPAPRLAARVAAWLAGSWAVDALIFLRLGLRWVVAEILFVFTVAWDPFGLSHRPLVVKSRSPGGGFAEHNVAVLGANFEVEGRVPGRPEWSPRGAEHARRAVRRFFGGQAQTLRGLPGLATRVAPPDAVGVTALLAVWNVSGAPHFACLRTLFPPDLHAEVGHFLPTRKICKHPVKFGSLDLEQLLEPLIGPAPCSGQTGGG